MTMEMTVGNGGNLDMDKCENSTGRKMMDDLQEPFILSAVFRAFVP